VEKKRRERKNKRLLGKEGKRERRKTKTSSCGTLTA